MIRLVVASNNKGKLFELRSLLPAAFELLSLSEAGLDSVDETGATFTENALLKATAAANATGWAAIADDSGLEVDALDGAPGVRSARFAGEPPDDAANIAKLLLSMRDVPLERRAARFRCAIALALPGGDIETAEGRCEGSIGFEPRGINGFGYDPIFVLADGRTMAELSASDKNAISHRARAIHGILPALDRLATAAPTGAAQ